MNEVHFINVDAAAIEAEAVERLESALGDTLFDGDERRIMLQVLLHYLIGCYALIDKTGRDNLVRYATGDALAALGERMGVTPLPENPAGTTLLFTLSAAQPNAVTIPQGTRATSDGRVFFATDTALTIPPGSPAGSVLAKSILQDDDSAETHNGIAVGRISTLVDRVPYVQSVKNTTPTTGGSAPESEDAFRERIILAPTRFSAAGSEGSYIYHARAASADVLDVSATMPSPGCTLITVLLPDGYEGAEAVLDKVRANCGDRDVRAVTDHLTVALPETIEYDIDLTYYAPLGQEAAISAAMEGAGGVIDQFIAWQSGALGRAINPDKLRALCFTAGVERLDLSEPLYTDLSKTQAARCVGIHVRREVAT